MVDYRKIDFDEELLEGRKSYDKRVGKWWHKQSIDGPHQRAYKRIADFTRELYEDRNKPEYIVDYGCGAGQMLTRIGKRFPKAKILGLDGSSRMLEIAGERLARSPKRVRKNVLLVETSLPDFSLPKGKADLVLFVFPNICPGPKDQPHYDKHGYKHKPDRKVARYLAKAKEEDPDEETVFDEPDTIFHTILSNKVISRNIRKLLKKGGLCVRVEYSNAPREEMTQLVQNRSAFEEGCLKGSFGKAKPKRIFKLLSSTYFRSKVIEDVYHQTRDKSDREGGYYINVLEAI